MEQKNRGFTTTVDNQTRVEVHVLQGESSLSHENVSLGRFVLTGLAPAPAGEPHIDVEFEIDVNGILQVTAWDLTTGRERSIVVRAGSGLTRSEIEKARVAAEIRRFEEDEIRKRNVLSGDSSRGSC